MQVCPSRARLLPGSHGSQLQARHAAGQHLSTAALSVQLPRIHRCCGGALRRIHHRRHLAALLAEAGALRCVSMAAVRASRRDMEGMHFQAHALGVEEGHARRGHASARPQAHSQHIPQPRHLLTRAQLDLRYAPQYRHSLAWIFTLFQHLPWRSRRKSACSLGSRTSRKGRRRVWRWPSGSAAACTDAWAPDHTGYCSCERLVVVKSKRKRQRLWPSGLPAAPPSRSTSRPFHLIT